MAQLGYACINITLNSKTRTLRLSTAKQKGIPYIHDIITENLQTIQNNMKFNVEHGIPAYRISSEIFPHITNPQLNGKVPAYNLTKKHKNIMREIGEYALSNKLHLSFHCTAFIHLGSTSSDVIRNSINEINIVYGYFIKFAKYPMIIVIHPDGCGEFIDEASRRFMANFKRLNNAVKSNLCIENTEVVNLHHTMKIAKSLGIPLVYDYFHAEVNKCDKPISTPSELHKIKSTWKGRHAYISKLGPRYSYLKIYKFHMSNQCDKKSTPGAHGDYVEYIPEILQSPSHVIMIEAKKKELAVFKLL